MKTRKFLCVLAALVLTVLSVGCGGGSGQNGSESAGSQVSIASRQESSVPAGESSAEDVNGELIPKITANPYAKPEADLKYGITAEKAADATEIAEPARKSAVDATTDPAPVAGEPGAVPAADPTTTPPAEPPEKSTTEPVDEPPASAVSVEDVTLPSEVSIPTKPDIQPAVGLLTAGVWNDNDNWGFFTNLVNTQKITLPVQYGVTPTNRTAVTVKKQDGSPAANVQVNLLDGDNKVLWSALTDHNGTAYLFAPDGVKPAAVEARMDDQTEKTSLDIKEVEQQSKISTQNNAVEIVFKGETKTYPKTEIMFVVDTTGSMGDELVFLQTEFTAIAEEAGTENTRFSINFYRDDGDDYTTKRYPFSSDIQEIQKKLNSESADGGGDLPEAVAEILDETIHDGGWSDDSVKLMFLIFDAPPHDDRKDMLEKAIRTAAEKGIRIIPVVSSNGDRNTELFGRCIAIATGGTYVFLTDDSHVGLSHLEPIIGSYKVEKLYDIIVRLIGNYRQTA